MHESLSLKSTALTVFLFRKFIPRFSRQIVQLRENSVAINSFSSSSVGRSAISIHRSYSPANPPAAIASMRKDDTARSTDCRHIRTQRIHKTDPLITFRSLNYLYIILPDFSWIVYTNGWKSPCYNKIPIIIIPYIVH